MENNEIFKASEESGDFVKNRSSKEKQKKKQTKFHFGGHKAGNNTSWFL